jgi:peptide/nickel transport system permease protein
VSLISVTGVRHVRGAASSLRRDPVVAAASGVLAVLVLLALLAPVIAPYPPGRIDLYAIDQLPSSAHLFGTDSLGRDIFSRTLYGARLSLLGPALVTLAASALGGATALVAAWYGGRLEQALLRALDILMAFPGLLYAVLAVVAFGTGLLAPAIALSIAYAPYIARVVHAVAASERRLPYIESLQLLGFPPSRTIGVHLLRNLRTTIVAQTTINFGYALLDLAALSFIGLGVQPPTAEWGLMVGDSSSALLNGSPQESIAAGGAIVLTVVAVNLLGERLAARAGRSSRS